MKFLMQKSAVFIQNSKKKFNSICTENSEKNSNNLAIFGKYTYGGEGYTPTKTFKRANKRNGKKFRFDDYYLMLFHFIYNLFNGWLEYIQLYVTQNTNSIAITKQNLVWYIGLYINKHIKLLQAAFLILSLSPPLTVIVLKSIPSLAFYWKLFQSMFFKTSTNNKRKSLE